MIDKVTEMEKVSYEMSSKIVRLSEENAMHETQIESLDKQTEKLRGKAEVVGSNTTFENAMSIHDDISDKIIGRKKTETPKQ